MINDKMEFQVLGKFPDLVGSKMPNTWVHLVIRQDFFNLWLCSFNTGITHCFALTFYIVKWL